MSDGLLTLFKIEELKCDQSCSGESSQICGGYLKMNLYNSHFHQKKIGYIPQESEYLCNFVIVSLT